MNFRDHADWLQFPKKIYRDKKAGREALVDTPTSEFRGIFARISSFCMQKV